MKKATKLFLVGGLCLLTALVFLGCKKARVSIDDSLERVKKAGVLKWGADVIGGEPYVYEDPKNPGQYIGFEMDIAKKIAKGLGVRQKLVIRAWDNLIPRLQEGHYDLAMNGIEDTPERRKLVALTQPYYVYTQQITVRNETNDIDSLEDLRGRAVATLSGTEAQDILMKYGDIKLGVVPEIIYAYQDLVDGKVDAVLLDTPIAAFYGEPHPKLKNVGEPFAEGTYVIAIRKKDKALKQAVERILTQMKEDGRLQKIYKKWKLWNSHQAKIGIK